MQQQEQSDCALEHASGQLLVEDFLPNAVRLRGTYEGQSSRRSLGEQIILSDGQAQGNNIMRSAQNELWMQGIRAPNAAGWVCGAL